MRKGQAVNVESRVAVLESNHADIKEAIVRISDSLEKFNQTMESIVRLEEKYRNNSEAIKRAFDACEKNDKRIADIEVKMPQIIETRGWVVNAVVGIVSLVGASVVGIVLYTKHIAG